MEGGTPRGRAAGESGLGTVVLALLYGPGLLGCPEGGDAGARRSHPPHELQHAAAGLRSFGDEARLQFAHGPVTVTGGVQ